MPAHRGKRVLGKGVLHVDVQMQASFKGSYEHDPT